jgi:ABC-2 type transport system ATP-binding protein
VNPLAVDVRHLTVRFGDTVALDDLSFSLGGGKIYGLLGRNGSGKTSLLSVLAAFRRASGGEARVGGADPFENGPLMRQICFVRDKVDAQDTDKVRAVLDFAAHLRPNWDAGYAAKLVELFDLPLNKRISSLSRGTKSALGCTLGLAARAPLTIFDESYLGMDAPSRYAFYDELLADYMRHPRTVILSTHLIEEVGALFEDVVILDRGRLIAHSDAESLRARGAAVTGPADAVDRFVTGLSVLNERRLGGTKSVTVYGELTDSQRAEARSAGLELGPVALQDLFVHLTKNREAHR